MTSNPTEPRPRGRSPGGRGEPEEEKKEEERVARYGTVALERHVRQDGRALILYARAEEDERARIPPARVVPPVPPARVVPPARAEEENA
jgi:hypothetical protein